MMGNIIPLSEDKFTFALEVYRSHLITWQPMVQWKLIATLRKSSVTPKIKQRNRVVEIVIDKSSNPGSGVGNTTLNDGLQYGTYPYGTRVQDRDISLNLPDVIQIYGIFLGDSETDGSDPESPSMTVGSMDGPTNTTNDVIIGEEIIGSISGAFSYM